VLVVGLVGTVVGAAAAAGLEPLELLLEQAATAMAPSPVNETERSFRRLQPEERPAIIDDVTISPPLCVGVSKRTLTSARGSGPCEKTVSDSRPF